jgi:uncharacterized metal-binding protein YceD (DUF177 family)
VSEAEFSRPLTLAEVAGAPRSFAIRAEPSERAALARRFGLVAIDRLEAEGSVRRHGVDGWRLEAELRADVVQTCVVTLEPFPATLGERFAVDYTGPADAPRREIDLGAGDAEPAPPDGTLDLGETVAQQLALALDPFPRRPGAELPPAASPGTAEGPFAALGRLRPKPGRGGA